MAIITILFCYLVLAKNQKSHDPVHLYQRVNAETKKYYFCFKLQWHWTLIEWFAHNEEKNNDCGGEITLYYHFLDNSSLLANLLFEKVLYLLSKSEPT